MASQQPTYMKAKLATGMILIFLFQIASVLPEVEQLDDFQTESRVQITSPQGVNDTSFVSMSARTFQYDEHKGDSKEFGNSLIVMKQQQWTQNGAGPQFNGNQVCPPSLTYQHCTHSLLIINYSSNSLVGHIYASTELYFDTFENSLHISALTAGTGQFAMNVIWPINSPTRNYSGPALYVFDQDGFLSSNTTNTISNKWPGYFTSAAASQADTSSYSCSMNSILAVSDYSNILQRTCWFQGGMNTLVQNGQYVYRPVTKHFNFTNTTDIQNITVTGTRSSGYSTTYLLVITQKFTNDTIEWTNPRLLMQSASTTCPTGTGGVGSSLSTVYSKSTGNNNTYVSTFWNKISDCGWIGTVDGNNATEFYTYSSGSPLYKAALTMSLNISTGQENWKKRLGLYPTDGYEILLTDNDLIFCGSTHSYSSGFVLNQTSLNMGSIGIVRINSSTGDYISHASLLGSGTAHGCGDSVSSGNDAFLVLQGVSYLNGQYSASTAITLVKLDRQNNFNHVYTVSNADFGDFNKDERAIIITNPENVNYGSGSMAGGDGLGIFYLQDDYDQDNLADNIDSDDDNDGYLDINDNCPKGMMGWTPGVSTDADSDGCHFSEDLDNDNDGIDDSLDNCDSPANSFTSTHITDYDGDGCRDSTEDDDDDNDNILDINDNCIKSVNNSDVTTNDSDSDGCGDSVEDSDDDNDGVFDVNDQCQTYPNTWQSSSNTDHDSDGCKDSLEDNDDDNDGINDNFDSCSTGKIGWIPTAENDGDSDGCFDANEDIDDDNDGVTDSADACPKQAGDSSFGSLLGCPDTDQDGYGDNIDSCESEYGTSFRDVYGCPDSDGDGYSNSGDDFPDDATAHSDSDSDGIEDSIDEFPFLPGQWLDGDGDGYGDNPTGPTPDSCVETYGNSTKDIYGCLDSDGDGYSDINDKFPNDKSKWLDTDNDGVEDSDDAFPLDPSQQTDSDGDGAGDNPTGVGADKFPNDSTQWSDIDGDSYGDNPLGTNPDAFITDATQWSDTDGDGYGDNPTGRLYDQFPQNPTQWVDDDGDGLGDNLNGTDADPYLNDFDNDGYNDSIDILPKLPSPGDLDADGCLDEDDAFPSNSQECLDNDGDGEGDNADVDDDNDGWADTDEIRLGTDPFNSAEEPVESFEIVIPGTSVGLGAWDLIGIFGGVPLFVWIGFGFITRNTRCAKYEVMLREANTRDELESVAYKWEYSLMLRMLGPHQGIRLERLRAELDDKFEAMDQPLSSIDNHEFDQTKMVVEEMNDTEKQVPELVTQSDYPSIEDTAQKTDDNGYEWFTSEDGTNFYRTIGSQADWTRLEN